MLARKCGRDGGQPEVDQLPRQEHGATRQLGEVTLRERAIERVQLDRERLDACLQRPHIAHEVWQLRAYRRLTRRDGLGSLRPMDWRPEPGRSVCDVRF